MDSYYALQQPNGKFVAIDEYPCDYAPPRIRPTYTPVETTYPDDDDGLKRAQHVIQELKLDVKVVRITYTVEEIQE